MNKLPTSPRLRRTGLTLFYFGAIIFGATSHAMDALRQGSGQAGQAGQVIPKSELGLSLRIAAREGNHKQVEELLKHGAAIDAKDNYGWTPLMYAAYKGHEQICKLLIDNKASIDAKDNHGWTAMKITAHYGYEQICKLLIDNKASIDAKNNNGNTPLIIAALNGHEQICKFLIGNKAAVDAKDNDGDTPLMMAARDGHEQTCKLLIDNKATIDAKDNHGNTPLIIAAEFDHEQTCKLLVDALLAPVKEKQAAAISLLGIKKFRNTPYFHHIDREVIRLIVRPAYEHSKRQLFAQINMIKNENFKQRLLDYAKQQLRVHDI